MEIAHIDRSTLLKQCGVALTYFLLGYLSFAYVPDSETVSVLWPSSGLALATLLIGGRKYLWGVCLGAFLLATLVYDTAYVVVGTALSNTLEAWLGYHLLTYRKDTAPTFIDLSDFVRLAVLGGGVASLVGAFGGVSLLLLSGYTTSEGFLHFVEQRWMGHTIGVVLITPLVFSWRTLPTFKSKDILDSAVLGGITLLVGQVVFLNWFHDSLGQLARGYWLFFCVVVLAIRFGTRGVTLSILVIALQAFAGALHGIGFFSDDIAKTGLHNYWFYMLILATVGLTISTYTEELKRTVSTLIGLQKKIQATTDTLTQMGRIAHVGGWELNLADMHLSWTEEVYRIHEVDPATQPRLEGAIDFYAPEAQPVIQAAIDRAIRDGKSWDLELPFITAKGNHIWVRAIGQAEQENGQTVRLYGAFQEITEQRKAKEAIRSLSLYTRSLLEASLDPMVTISPEGVITDVNSATESVTGLNRSELIGSEFATYFTDPDKAREGYSMAYAEGSVKDFPLSIRDTEGKIIDVLYNANVYRNEQGDVKGVFAVARDVTESKRTMQALYQANADLEGFSYSVSHDLRTPLRAIDGFSNILLEDYSDKLDEEGRRLLTVVRTNTQRMSTLIDDILHFSRAGRVAMTIRPIDLSDLTQQVIDELSALPDVRPVRFNVSPLPQIQGDPALLHQVLENLISNAIKFSAHNPAPVIDIGVQLEGNEAIISIRDNGVGFDMKYSDKLFGVFQRLHGINEFQGTGIGLAISKRIVNRHGGRIWAEAELGKGATFYFSIPMKENNHE